MKILNNKTFLSSRASIRTVLLIVVIMLGSWSLICSFQRMGGNLSDYSRSRNLSIWAGFGTRLLTAAQHFAYERGRTAVVLCSFDRISQKNRMFLDNRRKLADAALTSVFEKVEELPEIGYSDALKNWNILKEIRQQVDRDSALLSASRDPYLPGKWVHAANNLIMSIQQLIQNLVGYFPPGGITTRLTLLGSSALELRISAGMEANLIAQALSAHKIPEQEFMQSVYKLRGKENRLWNEIDRLASYLKMTSLQNMASEVKRHHVFEFRPIQDQVLKNLQSGRKSSVLIEKLTDASLPVLDGISNLTTFTAENTVKIAEEGMIRSRNKLVINSVWSFLIFLFSVMAVIYVVRFIVKPLEQIDAKLRRIGALSKIEESGNEISRLDASTDALENALNELQKALANVKKLSGLLPMCSNCKKVRDDKGYWQQVEEYVSQHSDTTFSHGLCPDCIIKLYPDIADEILKK